MNEIKHAFIIIQFAFDNIDIFLCMDKSFKVGENLVILEEIYQETAAIKLL